MTVYMSVNGSVLQTASMYNTNERCLHGKPTYVGEIDPKTGNHVQPQPASDQNFPNSLPPYICRGRNKDLNMSGQVVEHTQL